MERGLEGGQRPHNRPLSPARRAQEIESEQTGIKQKNSGGPLPRSYALRQSLRRRAGVRTKGNPLVLTSCRPPCGDGCVRPPVPKAKLWLEQAGSEHRASARGKGGDSGVWKGASKGGNAPITGPFPPPGGHKGNVREKRRENGKMPVNPAKKQRNGESPTPVEVGGGNV